MQKEGGCITGKCFLIYVYVVGRYLKERMSGEFDFSLYRKKG